MTVLKTKASFAFRHIQRATLILMAGTLAANIISFGKSLLIAMYYGTSAKLDAYFLSLAPLRLISGVLIGAVQATLIPTYLELSVKKEKGYAFAMLGTFSAWIMLLLSIVIIIFLAGSPMIAAYLGTGFEPERIHLTAFLLKISTILLLLTVLNDLGLCVFTAHRQFLFTSFVPLVNGVCSLGVIVYFHVYGVSTLMYGLICGMFVQSVVVLYGLSRFFPEHLFFLSPFNRDIQKTLKTMLPLLIGGSLGHVNVVIDQMMASTLPAGSIAALQYANKLHHVLTQLFIMVISSAVLPFFARQVAEHDIDAMKATFLLTIKRTVAILLPISVGIVIMGKPFVQLVFERGAFSADSTAATAGAWIAYTLGLPVMAIGILTARIYNALQENITLMYVSGGSIGLNILFNWIFMKFWGHVGIALSTSAVYVVATATLLYILHKKIGNLWA